MKTVNEFLKEMREVFGHIEYRAEKDGHVFKSKGYVDVSGQWVTPYTEVKINGNKPRRR